MRGADIGYRAMRDSDLLSLLPTIFPYSMTFFDRAQLVGKYDSYLKDMFKLRGEHRCHGEIAFDGSTQKLAAYGLAIDWNDDIVCGEKIKDLAAQSISGADLEFYEAAYQFGSKIFDLTPDHIKTSKTFIARHGWTEPVYRRMNVGRTQLANTMSWSRENGFDYGLLDSYKIAGQNTAESLGWFKVAEIPLTDFKMYDRIKHMVENEELQFDRVNKLYACKLND